MSTTREYCVKHGYQDFVDSGDGLCCPICMPELAAREKEFYIINVSVCFDVASEWENSFGKLREALNKSFEIQFVKEMLRRRINSGYLGGAHRSGVLVPAPAKAKQPRTTKMTLDFEGGLCGEGPPLFNKSGAK